MKKIIVFAVGENAQLFKYYVENDVDYKDKYQVIAFTLNKKYIKEDKFLNLPLVPFEELEEIYPPDNFYCFVALGYTDMNSLREEKLKEVKKKKYKTMNYISSKACVSTQDIGENNFIIDNSVIQPFVKLGSNNVIMGGGLIGHHSVVGDNCFFAGGANIAGKCIIEDNCFIGINSTVSHSVTLKYKTLVGGGAWISKDTEEYGVYVSKVSKKIEKKSIDIKI